MRDDNGVVDTGTMVRIAQKLEAMKGLGELGVVVNQGLGMPGLTMQRQALKTLLEDILLELDVKVVGESEQQLP